MSAIISDALDQLAELYNIADDDRNSSCVDDDQKMEHELVRDAIGEAWIKLHASFYPTFISERIIGVRIEDPAAPILTLTARQILQLAALVRMGSEPDKPIHICSIKGITSAFQISALNGSSGKVLINFPSTYKKS